MAGFTKLFGSIISSTIWGAEDHVRLVWITMLALADQYGRVESSVPGLAHQARVSVEHVRSALTILESPDLDSRTPDHEGRRIAKMDGGWRLLNHSKYRGKQDEEAQAQRRAEKQKRYRLRKKGALPEALRSVTPRGPIAEADTDTSNTPLPVTEEPISPEMVAMAVKEQLGLSGQSVSLCLIEIAKAKLKSGSDPEALRDNLVKAWLDYKVASPHLEWNWGSPASFYQSDKWHDSTLWPWKSGSAPRKKLKAVSE